MKKTISILGMVGISMATFFVTNINSSNANIDLGALLSMNTAKAEDSTGEKSCYNNLKAGSAQLVRFCLDCRRKSVEYGFEPGKCN